MRFNERLNDRNLSVEQLGGTDWWSAVLNSDWLEAMAQCGAQQIGVVSRFPLQITDTHASHRHIR